MKLKKRRLLFAVLTRRGLVHKKHDKIYYIESMDQLLALSQELDADKPASPFSSQLSSSSCAATWSSPINGAAAKCKGFFVNDCDKISMYSKLSMPKFSKHVLIYLIYNINSDLTENHIV